MLTEHFPRMLIYDLQSGSTPAQNLPSTGISPTFLLSLTFFFLRLPFPDTCQKGPEGTNIKDRNLPNVTLSILEAFCRMSKSVLCQKSEVPFNIGATEF